MNYLSTASLCTYEFMKVCVGVMHVIIIFISSSIFFNDFHQQFFIILHDVLFARIIKENSEHHDVVVEFVIYYFDGFKTIIRLLCSRDIRFVSSESTMERSNLHFCNFLFYCYQITRSK